MRWRCASRPMPKSSEKRDGLELEPERHRARPGVLRAVEEFLEQRVAEDGDEVDGQDAEQRGAAQHVERFDAVGRVDGRGHRVSLPRVTRGGRDFPTVRRASIYLYQSATPP